MKRHLPRLKPYSKKRFDALKGAIERSGFKVTNQWYKGLKSIKLEPIVLRVKKRAGVG